MYVNILSNALQVKILTGINVGLFLTQLIINDNLGVNYYKSHLLDNEKF